MQQQNGLDALPAFRRAAQTSPLSAKAWTDLGLQEEIEGDLKSAEAHLLHAAEVSREYVPRWTLLNYYFRRNDPAHFWPWARQALDVGSGELQPIFSLAWTINGNSDPASHNFVPERGNVLQEYLGWLTSQEKLPAAQAAAGRLLRLAAPDDVPVLLYYCNRQLLEANFSAAAEAWNGLAAAGLIKRDRVPTRDGLTGADFTAEPLNAGFDWFALINEGVTTRLSAGGTRIIFSGKQPENCELLSQFLLVHPDTDYELTYAYETSSIAPESGLAWRVFAPKNGPELTKNPPSLSSERPATGKVRFRTPPGAAGARLALTYRRAAGTMRIDGWVQLQHAALRPLP